MMDEKSAKINGLNMQIGADMLRALELSETFFVSQFR